MKFILLLSLIGFCWAQYDPQTTNGRTSIVHLFEWRWVDIAKECERYLAPKGFGGVQVRSLHKLNANLLCSQYILIKNRDFRPQLHVTHNFDEK